MRSHALVLSALSLFASACVSDLEESSVPEVASDESEITVCADGPTVPGIDVSKYQGVIDWAKVKAAGKQYAFIRVNHGLTDIDEKFATNWAGAKKAGVMRGAYQYFIPSEDAIEQADLFLAKMGPLEPGDLPPVLDVENAGVPAQTQATIQKKVHQWMDHVEAKLGVKPIIYTAKYFWQDGVGMPADFLGHHLWVANYNVTCPLMADPWKRWTFWQHSSTGSVAGIVGNVDLDKFNGTLEDLKKLTISAAVCGDAMCGTGESESCPADCEGCLVPAAGGTIDDASACFTSRGTGDSWNRDETTGEGGSLRWTYAWEKAEDNSGTWSIHVEEAGQYRVEAHVPKGYAGTKKAVYEVLHDGESSSVTIDQSAADGWTSLGEHAFTVEGEQHVRLGDATGEPYAERRKLVFDAVRLVPVDGAGGQDGGGDGDGAGDGPGAAADGEGGGCAIAFIGAGGAGGGAGLGGGVLLFGLGLALSAVRRSARRSARC